MSRLEEIEALARIAVDCGFQLHRDIGPGLLESVYEALLFAALTDRGLKVVRQVSVPITYKGVVVDNAFKADLIIEGTLLLELKSTERAAAVHGKQVLTYLRLLDLPLGLLMNFGQATFKDGLQRIVNNHR
ncbi:GxxExxY protein [Novosphingobium sp. ERW19]|uniref:GxxExxY protein n=1 Tax=Novosphingobium sp. ERW19 TaxID=2726186 RepID=UPI0014577CCE|nr:GxxExxY protein [Novosphingobium sp. ERW19]NLR40059.1 GxxExxY protein [Novosphingobium sp. ERW19]